MTPPPARENPSPGPAQAAPNWVPHLLRTIILSRLTQRQKTVLQTILQTANWKEWRLVSKQYYLAEKCGLSTATVCRALDELEALGLVEGVRRRQGHKLETTWSLKIDEIRALPSARSAGQHPMNEPSRAAPIVGRARAERPAQDWAPAYPSQPIEQPAGARPALEPGRARSAERHYHRPPEPPRYETVQPLAPGVWLYLSPETLQMDVLQQLQALMTGFTPQATPTSSQPPRTFKRPVTSEMTPYPIADKFGFAMKQGGAGEIQVSRVKGLKDYDIARTLKLQNEIATLGGAADLKFQNETHHASPLTPVDLHASVDSTNTSSSSSFAAQQLETTRAETAPEALAAGLRPASQEPSSAMGPSAPAPQRCAPPRARREVGGSSDLDLPLRLYPFPSVDIDEAPTPAPAPSKPKTAFMGEGGPPTTTPPGSSLPPPTAMGAKREADRASPLACDAPEKGAARCLDVSPGGPGSLSPPANSLEKQLFHRFESIIHRWTGGEGVASRWAAPPGLERWFVELLRSDAVEGLHLEDVLMSWAGYLENRAARGLAFTTPTDSFRQQLEYVRRGLARSRRAARSEAEAAGKGVRKPRPPEGAVAEKGGVRFQYQYTQLYPISISYREYLAMMGPHVGPDETLPTWEEFRAQAMAEGNHPIP